jgi:plastocyanin
MPKLTRRRVIASVSTAVAVLLLLTAFATRGAATKSAVMAPSMNMGAPGSSPAVDVAPNSVDITNFSFAPAVLTLTTGTTVTWTNRDSIAHTVTDEADGISSPVLNQGDTFTYRFTKPGTYNYICTIHPEMHGTIVVTSS